jgi:glutaredoxin
MTFRIYSTPTCSYCKKAKELLDEHKFKYNEYVVGVDYDRDMLYEDVTAATGTPPVRLTVPQIWHGGTYIGGYDDLVAYMDDCGGGLHDLWR